MTDTDALMQAHAARRRAVACLSLGLLLLCSAASAQTSQLPAARPVDNAYLTLNLGWQGEKRAFIESSSMGLYDETANFDILYSSSADLIPGAFLGVRAWRDLSVAIGVTRFRTPADVNLRGTVPHPLFFGQARAVDQQLPGFEHQQVGVHMQLVWIRRLNERVDVAFSAGPSLFLVTQDRVADLVAGDEVAPYDEVMISAGRAAAETKAVGANAGIELTVSVARHLGLGIFVRWTEGKAEFPEFGPDQTVTAGGIQGGVGLRFRF